jgi:hypothetical protein
MTDTALKGYDFGAATVPRSPVSMDDLEQLQALLRFDEADVRRLRQIGELLAPELMSFMEQLMEWTGPIAMTSVVRNDGTVDEAYAEAAHRRFAQGFLDTCTRQFDRSWLDYQHEVGLRHHRAKKNVTDGGHATPHIPFRWMLAFLEPTVETMAQFLQPRVSESVLPALVAAWRKAMLLQVILYSAAYMPEEDW